MKKAVLSFIILISALLASCASGDGGVKSGRDPVEPGKGGIERPEVKTGLALDDERRHKNGSKSVDAVVESTADKYDGADTKDAKKEKIKHMVEDPDSPVTVPDSYKPDKKANGGYTPPQAGEHDDNEEYQYYQNFMLTNAPDYPFTADYMDMVRGRVLLTVLDRDRAPVSGALIDTGSAREYTYADGESMVYGVTLFASVVKISYNGFVTNVRMVQNGYQRQEIVLPVRRVMPQGLALDIVFVMDTTGSMQDEIDALRDTVYSIYQRIRKLPAQNMAVRFGMVLYRDQGDDYVTKKFDLTADIEKFQEFLFAVEAGGGGDYPEDIVSALDVTMGGMNYKKDAVKMVFLITDAPGQMEGQNRLRFAQALIKAREQNIKVFSIGASGLNVEGEVTLRLLSQLTKGKFIFMTYGEKGESDGKGTPDDPGKVSHHTGANYTSRNLDDIVVDNVRREIYFQLPAPVVQTARNSYDYRPEEDKVYRRVDNALQQIMKQLDAKVWGQKRTVLVLPADFEDASLSNLGMHVAVVSELVFTTEKLLQVVDRSKLQDIIKELKIKLSGMTQNEKVKLLADVDSLLACRIYFIGDTPVMFFRLIDAGTAEILAASMVRI